MAKVTSTINNGTIQLLRSGEDDYVRIPVGSIGGGTAPYTKDIDGKYTSTFVDEWDITYDDEQEIKDVNGVLYYKFIGGRPTGR